MPWRVPQKVPFPADWGRLKLALSAAEGACPESLEGMGGVSPRCHSGVIHRDASYLGHLLK